MLEQFYEKDKIELGIDEAGRGCLFGPVVVASVIWPDKENFRPYLRWLQEEGQNPLFFLILSSFVLKL